MKKITHWLNDSTFIAPLSPACRMCAKGSKMVVLVTGKCSTKCYYCPLSFKKGGTDRIFADEWELENEHDTTKLIDEAESIGAQGAGITGGDPLVVWKRVQTYITLLKQTFGEKFHIHLYTSGLTNGGHLKDLVTAGLDEVRFHPLVHTWNTMNKNPLKTIIKAVVNTPVDVAIEIPVIPHMEKEILSLVSWADNQGIQWINLNELEFSERNVQAFITRNYQVKNEVSAAVKGSQETAEKILTKVQRMNLDIGIHYCSVSFKDGIQLRNRIKRRAERIARPYDVITDEGTLLKGAIYPQNRSLHSLLSVLRTTYHVPSHHLYLDAEKKRIEIATWILEKIAPALAKQGHRCYIVEEYPTADRLEVERYLVPTR